MYVGFAKSKNVVVDVNAASQRTERDARPVGGRVQNVGEIGLKFVVGARVVGGDGAGQHAWAVAVHVESVRPRAGDDAAYVVDYGRAGGYDAGEDPFEESGQHHDGRGQKRAPKEYAKTLEE